MRKSQNCHARTLLGILYQQPPTLDPCPKLVQGWQVIDDAKTLLRESFLHKRNAKLHRVALIARLWEDSLQSLLSIHLQKL